MVQGSRQYHSKTRNGCGQCKKRRVRCNLEPPVCSNCRRRGESCDYTPGDVSVGAVSSPMKSSSFSSQTSSASTNRLPSRYRLCMMSRPSSLPSSLSEPTTAAQCMISFILDNVWIEPRVPANQDTIWRTTLEAQAMQFHYLDQSASSLWSIYQSFQSSPSSSSAMRANAYLHNLKASSLFRESDQVITEQNWFAVLSFGITVVIFHFAVAQEKCSINRDYLEIFKILRSTSSIAQAVLPYFEQSPLRLFLDHRQSLLCPKLDQDIWRRFEVLEDAILCTEDVSKHVMEILHSAIKALMVWVSETDAYPRSWVHFLKWPGIVSDDFLQLLCDGNQLALIIFIYWCTIMHGSPKRWFLGGWACRDACSAMKVMDTAWNYLLEWPKAVIRRSALESPMARLL